MSLCGGVLSNYARDAMLRTGTKPSSLYDPFGGSGTTQLVASLLGIPSFYSELNPFMCFVAETKVTSAKWATNNLRKFEDITKVFSEAIQSKELDNRASAVDLANYRNAFPNRDYFEEVQIREILAALEIGHELSSRTKHTKDLLNLAIVGQAINCSNMTRRADLRRRRSDEYKNRVVDVRKAVTDSVQRIVTEVRTRPKNMASMTKVAFVPRGGYETWFRNDR